MRSAPSTSSCVEVRLDDRVARRYAIARRDELDLGPSVPRAQMVEHDGRLRVRVPAGHAGAARAIASRAAVTRRRAATARARIESAIAVPLDASSVASVIDVLASLDVAQLDEAGLLARLRLADRVSSWAQATAATALADYATPVAEEVERVEPQAAVRRDRHLRLEVRVARGISDDAAGRDIDAARRLAADLAPVRAAWTGGDLSFRHVASFLERTRDHAPATISALLDHLGERMHTTPAHRIGTVVGAALARLDPAGQAARARTARRHDVGVSYRGLPDGLAQVIATHRVEDARALIEHIDSAADDLLAHRRGCAACAEALPDEIGPARAAAHTAVVLRQACDHMSSGAVGPAHGAQVTGIPVATTEVQVVVDLPTLLGLADNPGLLAGQPVPADIARELAGRCGSLRRIVTDPLTGALLDYGTRTYLPDALRAFVAARDGTCTSPGCGQPGARSQLDHITPFPHGPSSPANTHMLCKRDHDTKTTGDIEVRRDDDGCTTWTTRHGQHGSTPPRPYLPDTSPPASPTPPDDLSGCPF